MRLEQVTVQGRLGSFGHAGIRGLAGDHDKHGGEGQQLVAAQVVEQVLARRILGRKVLLAEHKIKAHLFQMPARIDNAAALRHILYAEIPQLRNQQRSHGRIAFNHQCPCISNVFI